MTHGQAAQDPEVHRVCECVCLRLFKEFKQARNRPKDRSGKTLPIPQSIVAVYSHLKQLLEDSRAVLGQTNLVLVPINTTTVASWLLRRQTRTDRDMLLQGTDLPSPIHLAKEPLPEVRELPAAPLQHGHDAMFFEEPENQEGEAFVRKRISKRCPLPSPPPGPYSFPIYSPAAEFASYPPFTSLYQLPTRSTSTAVPASSSVPASFSVPAPTPSSRTQPSSSTNPSPRTQPSSKI